MSTDRICASLLALTYAHRVTAFHPLPGGGEEPICEDAPCALFRSAQVSASEPPDQVRILPETRYRLSLYIAPDLRFQLGDRLEVRDGSGRAFRCRVSDSFRYPSRCVMVLEVLDAEEADRTHVRREAL